MFTIPAKVFSSMYLILLKDRSSWLRFFSWSKASLGTSFSEFRATLSRRRSLGKVWWGRACGKLEYSWAAANHVGPTDASTIFWRGTDHPSWSQLGRALSRLQPKKDFKGFKLNHGSPPPPFYSCIQYRSCQNHIKCKKILEQKIYIFLSFVAVVCPFGTFGDHISV